MIATVMKVQVLVLVTSKKLCWRGGEKIHSDRKKREKEYIVTATENTTAGERRIVLVHCIIVRLLYKVYLIYIVQNFITNFIVEIYLCTVYY